MSKKSSRIGALLGVAARFAADPALGGRGAAISSVLSLASILLQSKQEDHPALTAVEDHINPISAEGRVPTHEEWNVLGALASFVNQSPQSPDGTSPPKA